MRSPLRWLLVAGALMGLLMLGLYLRQGGDTAAARMTRVEVTRPLESATDETVRTFLGQLEPSQTSRIGFDMPGRVEMIAVEEGDSVQRGQLLAVLDSDRLRAQRRQARAEVARRQSRAELATNGFQRADHAKSLDAIAEQAWDEAASEMFTSQAALEAARAALDAIDVDLGKSRLYAPFAGKISEKFSDPGAVLSSGEPLLEVLDISTLKARIDLPETVAQRLRPGNSYPLRLGKQRLSVPGTLERVLPRVTGSQRSVQALLVVRQVPRGVRSGSIAEMSLSSGTQREDASGMWLPTGALTRGAKGLWACLVAEPLSEPAGEATHRLNRRHLSWLGQTGEMAHVRGNVASDELVVSSGLHKVVPGQLVALAP